MPDRLHGGELRFGLGISVGDAIDRTAALEYAQSGIRVNALCPGVIRTRAG